MTRRGRLLQLLGSDREPVGLEHIAAGRHWVRTERGVHVKWTKHRRPATVLLLVLAAALALGSGPCDHHNSGGGRTSVTASLPPLSIATVNIANATDVAGINWQTRIDRLSAAIESAQLVPTSSR